MPEEKETVTVSKAQLDSILAQNAEILEENRRLSQSIVADNQKPNTLRPDEVKERTVRILFVDGKAVQGFKNVGTDTRPSYVYSKPDPENPKERILFVDVLFNGSKEAVSVPYNDLLREGIREECKILNEEKKEWDVTQGQTTQKVVKDYATEETGILVPIRVIGEKRVFTVALPEGGEMVIHENFVNM